MNKRTLIWIRQLEFVSLNQRKNIKNNLIYWLQKEVKVYSAARDETMHISTTHNQHTSNGLETTLSMIISRQGMFTDKHVTIYKNI